MWNNKIMLGGILAGAGLYMSYVIYNKFVNINTSHFQKINNILNEILNKNSGINNKFNLYKTDLHDGLKMLNKNISELKNTAPAAKIVLLPDTVPAMP